MRREKFTTSRSCVTCGRLVAEVYQHVALSWLHVTVDSRRTLEPLVGEREVDLSPLPPPTVKLAPARHKEGI